MAATKLLSPGRLTSLSITKLSTQAIPAEAVTQGTYSERIKLARPLNAFITELTPNGSPSETSPSRLQPSPSPIGNGLRCFAVKDNYCTKDVRTTCGSKMLENFVPAYTATVVQTLLDCGMILMGKTNMDEFAMGSGSVDSIFGPVQNPSNPVCIAGGSSGGSAVAVACGAVDFALGSDTGGSVRNPASYCGVVGFKPSYGTVSRHGLISLVNSTDVPAIFARSVSDAGAVFKCISGWDPKDSTTFKTPFLPHKQPEIRKLRIGIPKEFILSELGDHLSRYRDVAQRLEYKGATIRPISLPHAEYANACYTVLCACDVASNMARYDGIEFGHRSTASSSGTDALYAATRHEGFNEVVRGRILAGNYFLLKRNYKEYFVQAAKVRRLIMEDFQRVFADQVDVILAPVTFGPAPTLEDFRKVDNRTQQEIQDLFTVGASLAGLPAVSVPVGVAEQGMPVGMQLIGPYRKDPFLLGVARLLEDVHAPVELATPVALEDAWELQSKN